MGLVVHLFTPSMVFGKWLLYRLTNFNIVLQLLLNYKYKSLIFSKYWSKTIRKQKLQNKDNRTKWVPEFFVIYWPESLNIVSLIMYQILPIYFFHFSFCSYYCLEKIFVPLKTKYLKPNNKPILLTFISLFIIFDMSSTSKFS